MELFRDQAADQIERHTGSTWRPRSGSLASRRTLTAAVIDSRDYLAARRRAETQVMVPPGPKVAFTGGLEFNDHHLIWHRLDRVAGNHFVTLTSGLENLAEFGRLALWECVQPIRFETA